MEKPLDTLDPAERRDIRARRVEQRRLATQKMMYAAVGVAIGGAVGSALEGNPRMFVLTSVAIAGAYAVRPLRRMVRELMEAPS